MARKRLVLKRDALLTARWWKHAECQMVLRVFPFVNWRKEFFLKRLEKVDVIGREPEKGKTFLFGMHGMVQGFPQLCMNPVTGCGILIVEFDLSMCEHRHCADCK